MLRIGRVANRTFCSLLNGSRITIYPTIIKKKGLFDNFEKFSMKMELSYENLDPQNKQPVNIDHILQDVVENMLEPSHFRSNTGMIQHEAIDRLNEVCNRHNIKIHSGNVSDLEYLRHYSFGCKAFAWSLLFLVLAAIMDP